MICPNCGSDQVTEPLVNALAICRACLRSVVVMGEVSRLARAEDTVSLRDSQLAQLKQARKQAREARR